ncbi:MAG: HAD hydrolase family protein [Holophagales bacterium]|nr:HAD hydrolase family protein [Holophagales bacterium]
MRNRQELMLVPAGVSKGTGLFDALGDLGISRHSTLAVGDAENDHSLLGACELGVAVANAVPSLKEAADVVLSEGGSAGLARFLLGPAVLSDETPEPRRFQAVLGTWEDGSAAKVPASGVNVLVTGGTMSGKSHLTGLLAERLLGLGYSLCVLDPEGDHVSLGRLRGVLAVGGNEPLPGPEQLPRLIEHRFGSVVVDLSFLEPSAKLAYCRAALEELAALWSDTGLPHWLFVDEAQVALNLAHDRVEGFDPRRPGTCLTTWQPEHLPEEILESLDVVLDLGAEEASNLPGLGRPGGGPARARAGPPLAPRRHRAAPVHRGAPRQPARAPPPQVQREGAPRVPALLLPLRDRGDGTLRGERGGVPPRDPEGGRPGRAAPRPPRRPLPLDRRRPSRRGPRRDGPQGRAGAPAPGLDL